MSGKKRDTLRRAAQGVGRSPAFPACPARRRGTLNVKRRVTQPCGRAGRGGGWGARAAAARAVRGAAACGAVCARLPGGFGPRARERGGELQVSGGTRPFASKTRRAECGSGPGPGRYLCVVGRGPTPQDAARAAARRVGPPV